MINLAGRKDCDSFIAQELQTAGIRMRRQRAEYSEVPYSIIGKINGIILTRAWSYWVANGDVEKSIAEELYRLKGKEIRVDGHCGCPEPVCPWLKSYDLLGNQLILDESVTQEKKIKKLINKGLINQEYLECKFVSSLSELEALATFQCVDIYHIDTQEGLNVFAKTIMAK